MIFEYVLHGTNKWAHVCIPSPSLFPKLHPRNISWEHESGHSLLPFMNLTVKNAQGGEGATPKTQVVRLFLAIFSTYLPWLWKDLKNRLKHLCRVSACWVGSICLGCWMTGRKTSLIRLQKDMGTVPSHSSLNPECFSGKLIHQPHCPCHAETQRAAHSASLFGSLVVRWSHLTQKRPMIFERLREGATHKFLIWTKLEFFLNLGCWGATLVKYKWSWQS